VVLKQLILFMLKEKSKGFTLVEVMVSLSIIGIMSTVFLVNYHSTNQRSALILSSKKMASDIRMAQNHSLGSKEYGSGNIPSGGWGVYIDKTSSDYIIFADNNGNYSFDSGEDDSSLGAEIVNFPSRIGVKSITVNGVDVNTASIVFLPPNPKTYINTLDGVSAKIILEEDVSFSTSTVEINYFGLIDS
jgi:prepilin-type N-terminal cleavage/methylation domain-containing protein